MIVWLASYPRSGNTMFRMALHHLYGIETYSIYTDADIVGMGADKIVGHHGRANAARLRGMAGTQYIKTHELAPAPTTGIQDKAIHIVRDGRDALVSYAHYRVSVDGLQLTPSRSLDELLDIEHVGNRWGGWSGHAKAWLDWPGTKVMVRYEDMLTDTMTTVTNALHALGINPIPVNGGEMPKFKELGEKWPQFFRKGKSGSWREHMTDGQLSKFWNQHSKMMGALGYGFN